MAQAHPGDHETLELGTATATNPGGVSFKFNAQAPEFVPRSQSQMGLPGCYYPCVHFLGGGGGADWFYVGDQEPVHLISGQSTALPNCSKNFLNDDLRQRIVKQVEYQLSDMSLLANDSLVKHMNKDPEGYVPLSVIASSKKIKSLMSNNYHLLVQALQSSSKLIVSEDGKKVKRKSLFTERDKEDLQSRTVVAENLPEDHSHQNIEKIFSVVGRVKTIRIWHPQESNASRPKGDYVIGNKVEKLNDERNWRKGLRVRLVIRRSPKSVLKSRKSEFDGYFDDDELLTPESAEDPSHTFNVDSVTESNAEENSATPRKGWGRGRGKPRVRTQTHNGRGLLAQPPHPGSPNSVHLTKGPRMPDGTRGFAVGRGKPVSSPAAASSE